MARAACDSAFLDHYSGAGVAGSSYPEVEVIKAMGKVVILGLGKTGLSCVNYFLRKGITPTVLDTRQNQL